MTITNLIVAQVRLSGQLPHPKHCEARRIADAPQASTVASARAMPAMNDHDSDGGIHGTSHAGAEPFRTAK